MDQLHSYAELSYSGHILIITMAIPKLTLKLWQTMRVFSFSFTTPWPMYIHRRIHLRDLENLLPFFPWNARNVGQNNSNSHSTAMVLLLYSY